MRESIGGTWILSIVMTFLMLFTAYLAVSVNYAKAFRIKNYIISEIETVEIGDGDDDTSLTAIEDVDFKNHMEAYLINQAYATRDNCGEVNIDDYPGYELVDRYMCSLDDDDFCGVCVFAREAEDLDDYTEQDKYYYTVVDFFRFDLPLLGDFLTFKVKGNSRAV